MAMFRKIVYNGLSVLSGVKPAWIKPLQPKAKFLELSEVDLISKTVAGKAEYTLPEIIFNNKRIYPDGNTLLIQFNPLLGVKGGSCHFLELEPGDNVFGSFDGVKIAVDKLSETSRWVVRIYDVIGGAI